MNNVQLDQWIEQEEKKTSRAIMYTKDGVHLLGARRVVVEVTEWRGGGTSELKVEVNGVVVFKLRQPDSGSLPPIEFKKSDYPWFIPQNLW